MLKAIINAHKTHAQVKKSEVGNETHAHWVALTDSMLVAGYKVWSNTHDVAGRPVTTVSPKQMEDDEKILFNNLKNLQKLLGEIPFRMGGSAPLELNAELGKAVANISCKMGWEYSDEVQKIKDRLVDAKDELKFAQDALKRLQFNGVNEDALAKAQAEVEKWTKVVEDIDNERKDAEKQECGKMRKPMPNDENPFRLALAEILYSAVENQSAMTYDDYKAMKDAQKKARKERTKKNKARKAQAEK